jgi:hypothetical protein
LTVRENIGVPTFVTLFYILHYACLGGLYFCLEYHGVEPKIEEYAPFLTPILHPSTSDFIGLRTVCIPDQAPCIIWGKPVLLIISVRKLKVEWLMFCCLSVILSVPISWVHSPCPGAFLHDHNGFEFALTITHKSVDHCLGFQLSYCMHRWKSQDNVHCCCWGHPHHPSYGQTV